jgi:phage FluMu gp28-like protein
VDATGIGEPVASFLAGALGSSRVERVKLSAETKSRLGFELLSAVNGGRVRIHNDSSLPERTECLRQLERCRAVYRANRTLSFFVEERDGHDDYVVSLALAVAASSGAAPRRARGRSRDEAPDQL